MSVRGLTTRAHQAIFAASLACASCGPSESPPSRPVVHVTTPSALVEGYSEDLVLRFSWMSDATVIDDSGLEVESPQSPAARPRHWTKKSSTSSQRRTCVFGPHASAHRSA